MRNFAPRKLIRLNFIDLRIMEERVLLNRQLAQMLKGGVIMDVTTPEQARIAEAAGACAVMALERIPADIRAAGGVSRMSDPKMIKGIQEAVSILRRLRFLRLSRLTISMRARCSALLMISIISTSATSRFPLSAVRRTWARLCAVSTRVLR